jgi:hypothetical protein
MPKKDAVSGYWYKAVPLAGIHSIEGTTRRLMLTIDKEESREKKIFTNSSLRCTSQMRHLIAGLPKEVIQKRLGVCLKKEQPRHTLKAKITNFK